MHAKRLISSRATRLYISSVTLMLIRRHETALQHGEHISFRCFKEIAQGIVYKTINYKTYHSTNTHALDIWQYKRAYYMKWHMF